MRRQEAARHARLAQLVEHLLDVQEVTGSSPVPRTKSPSGHSGGDFSVYRRGKNQAKSPTFFKKGLAFCKNICYTNMRCQSAAQYARLAQLVEHLLDVQEVTGSSPVPRTKSPSGHPPGGDFFVYRSAHFRGTIDETAQVRYTGYLRPLPHTVWIREVYPP